jgi:hypothetical protein
LADKGRTAVVTLDLVNEKWVSNHPVLQDGACLQALKTKDIYRIILSWYTRNKKRVLHQELLDDAKEKVEQFTGLRPTNERLLKSIKTLAVPLQLRDHVRNMLIGRIKCSSYWANIPGYDERSHWSFYKERAGTGGALCPVASGLGIGNMGSVGSYRSTMGVLNIGGLSSVTAWKSTYSGMPTSV